MSSNKIESDNLELITGIGPEAQKWLSETFDVRTFMALAELSEEELVDRIKSENKPTIWLRWANNWPKEAALKAAEKDIKLETEKPSQETDPGIYFSKSKSPTDEKDGWETLALYFVEFQSRSVPGKPYEIQTLVVFEGPGPRPQEQDILPGIDRDRICQWIFEHFEGILPTIHATEMLPGTLSKEVGFYPIKVNKLHLFQPSGAISPLFSYSREQVQLSSVKAGQSFDLEVTLEKYLPETSAIDRGGINVHFFVKNWDTKEVISLGSVEPITIDDHSWYSAFMQDVRLSHGKYQLQVLVLAHPKQVFVDSLKIPFLNVY